MAMTIDAARGRQAAALLYESFRAVGIHGHTDMPEDTRPRGAELGSPEHLAFITLTVTIDYLRDAPELWASSRRTFEDPSTSYLFDYRSVSEAPLGRIAMDMKKHGLSWRLDRDPAFWRGVATSFARKWDGNPKAFLEDCHWEGPTILQRLKADAHRNVSRIENDFPGLRGDKIGPLWLRMLRDNVGITELTRLDCVPIPVDVHVARATLALGVVRGQYTGRLEGIFQEIRKAWFLAVQGLHVSDRAMIALDVDEPLWHLSKYGCTLRSRATGECPALDRCEAKSLCVQGRLWVSKALVELET